MAEYVTLQELRDFGHTPAAFVDETATRRRQAVRAASDVIDGYLGRFTLPLTTWGEDIKQCCAVLASISIIRSRGVSPEDGESLDKVEDRWIMWLRDVGKGLVTPRVIDSSPSGVEGVPARPARVISGTSRGFSVRGTVFQRGPFQGD